MSPFAVRVFLLCAFAVVAIAVGNALLKVGMDRVALAQPVGVWATLRTVITTWQVVLGVVLMAGQFAAMLTLFAWGLDVSVVVPVFGLNYVATALLGQFWLGEPVGITRWSGIVLVTAGVALIARTMDASR